MTRFTVVILDAAYRRVWMEHFGSFTEMAERESLDTYPEWIDRMMLAADFHELPSPHQTEKEAVSGTLPSR